MAVQGRDESELVEVRGTQVGDESLDVVQARLELRLQPAQDLRLARQPVVGVPPCRAQPQRYSGQQRTQLIVHVPADAVALLVPSGQQALVGQLNVARQADRVCDGPRLTGDISQEPL